MVMGLGWDLGVCILKALVIPMQGILNYALGNAAPKTKALSKPILLHLFLAYPSTPLPYPWGQESAREMGK